jgi:hypothetical protein
MAVEESPPSHLTATLPVSVSSSTTVTSAASFKRAEIAAATSQSAGEQQRNISNIVPHVNPSIVGADKAHSTRRDDHFIDQ